MILVQHLANYPSAARCSNMQIQYAGNKSKGKWKTIQINTDLSRSG